MLDTIKNDVFYSPEELSEKFKISLSSVYKLVRSGEIPSIRLGKIYRIPESDLGEYLKRKKFTGQPKTSIPESAKNFVDHLKKWKQKDRIKEVYLYGSYARGDYDEDSDIDIYVVVDKLDLTLRKEISHFAEEAMQKLDYQELLSIHEETLESWERMQKANYPLIQNILREGIPLWKNQ